MVGEKLLVILGPTATGKTDVAIDVAKKLGGELVVCDSRQIYQGLDIWSGKLPARYQQLEKNNGYWVVDGIKIWGYDLVSVDQRFSVKEYIEYARAKIKEISQRGQLPVIVGGTGLYLRGLLNGLADLEILVDEKLRAELADLTLPQLQQKLADLYPTVWQELNNSERQNKRRLIRRLEKLASSQKPIDDSPAGIVKDYEILKIGLSAPREILNQRIDQRVLSQVDNGLIEEGRQFLAGGVDEKKLHQLGLEYRQMRELLAGEISQDQFIKQIQTKVHQYARRQETWFKLEPGVEWWDISSSGWQAKLAKRVADWYNNSHESTN